MPKQGSQCICLLVIIIDSVFRTGKNCYTSVFLEQYRYIVEEKWCLNILMTTSKFLKILTLFRMGFFRDAHGWGNQKGHPSLKSVTHIPQWWSLAQLYLISRRLKKIMNDVTHHLSSAFFHWKSSNFPISRSTDIDCILIHSF